MRRFRGVLESPIKRSMAFGTSVIVPVRNGSNFLVEAVESALGQLGPADEVLIVWDDSDDDTASIIGGLRDSRVCAIKGPGRGVSGGRNAGLAAASGEFIAFLDHDDLWPTDRHQMMIQVMADDPQIDAVFGRMRIRLDPGATPWQWVLDLNGRHVPGPNLGTGLFRSRILRRVDGFDESLHFGEDLDYFLRLREMGMQISLCDIDGLIYRRHATNSTDNQKAVRNSVFDVMSRRIARARSSQVMSRRIARARSSQADLTGKRP
jgi:glycosyltransferase involved in cell wall biosynthesis